VADEFRINGIDGVVANMKAHSLAVRGKVGRAAGRKGANVIRDAAVIGWQQVDRAETPNKIYENVAVQFAGRTFRATGDIMFRVGIRGGARQYANTKENRRKRRVGESYKVDGSTFYWRFYELGTSRQPARPVMQPALFNNAPTILSAFIAELTRGLARIQKKGR
jgi:HK97 gp10 family phage protein